jgi:hypothetical protein
MNKTGTSFKPFISASSVLHHQEKTMPKSIIKPLIFTILLGSALNTEVSANNATNFVASNFFTGTKYEDNFTFSKKNIISMKRGEKYDESKDPALRKGTENTEQPQSSFFAIPALVVGIMLAFLFFNRDK